MNDFYGYSQPPLRLSPEDIRFTQDSVAMCFQNGNDVNETCEEIVKGKLSVHSFPKIKVVAMNNHYYSFDNRRLYVFRVLNFLGQLSEITVTKKNQAYREFTTTNGGCHVHIRSRPYRKAVIYRHCLCSHGQNLNLLNWWSKDHQCHISMIALPHPSRNTARFPTVYSIDRDYSNMPSNRSFTASPLSEQEPRYNSRRIISFATSDVSNFTQVTTPQLPNTVYQALELEETSVAKKPAKAPETEINSNSSLHNRQGSSKLSLYSESMNDAGDVSKLPSNDNYKASDDVNSDNQSTNSSESQSFYKQKSIPVVVSQTSVNVASITSNAMKSRANTGTLMHDTTTVTNDNPNQDGNIEIHTGKGGCCRAASSFFSGLFPCFS